MNHNEATTATQRNHKIWPQWIHNDIKANWPYRTTTTMKTDRPTTNGERCQLDDGKVERRRRAKTKMDTEANGKTDGDVSTRPLVFAVRTFSTSFFLLSTRSNVLRLL